jgi:hypothetical protein
MGGLRGRLLVQGTTTVTCSEGGRSRKAATKLMKRGRRGGDDHWRRRACACGRRIGVVAARAVGSGAGQERAKASAQCGKGDTGRNK